MRISVMGLGYVGAVTCACLARDGHSVIGVDTNADKVAQIAQGKSPIIEPGLAVLLADGVATGRLSATTDAEAAIHGSEMTLVSVGTPSRADGSHDLSFVYRVFEQLGSALATSEGGHVVVLRSTVPPGTTARCRQILTDLAGTDRVHLAFNPEFLREGSAISDYDRPPYTVIGTDSKLAEQMLRSAYSGVAGDVIVVDTQVAEMVKVVANTWHATKITFANEMGRISRALGIDGRSVMRLIAADTKLNVSSVYMRPGFAYGGSCLPKDVASLQYQARAVGVPSPLLESLTRSNEAAVSHAAALILESKPTKVALLGLAFKGETDDLRESPSVALAKILIGEGCELSIFDRCVRESALIGGNLAYINANLPHFARLMVDEPDAAVRDADVVVVSYRSEEHMAAAERSGSGRIVDLAGVWDSPPKSRDYVGAGW
jgi:GDP-mannose 6-dehydrogenase